MGLAVMSWGPGLGWKAAEYIGLILAILGAVSGLVGLGLGLWGLYAIWQMVPQ